MLNDIKTWLIENYDKKYKLSQEDEDLFSEATSIIINNNNMLEYIKKYANLIDKYLNTKTLESGNKISMKSKFKRLFFELNIQENFDEIISLIITNEESGDIFKNYYEMYNDVSYDLTNEIKNILNSDEFFDLLLNILKSKVVKNYFCNKKNFSEKNIFGVEFLNDNFNKDCDINFKNAYEIFIGKIEKHKDWFTSLFIFKNIPKGVRAFMEKNLRFIMNPLFIKPSEELTFMNTNDPTIMKEILTSYLIIIILHEIVHLLKFIKDKDLKTTYKNLIELPNTPKGREGGKILIYYLFGKPEIQTISLAQAKKINNIDSWQNVSILYDIFSEEESNKIDKKDKINLCAIKFYLSEKKDEKKIDWSDIN